MTKRPRQKTLPLAKAQFVLALGILLLLLIVQVGFAQMPQLRTYRIACDPDELEQIYLTPHENIYISCELMYNGQVWHNARLRIRGDTSRDYPKKSYRVNFDADQRFFGRDKMNLVSEWLDASYSHEFLSYDTFHRAGLEASQTWFARVYINDVYMGLYLDVEQVDEFLLARSSLNDNSSVYKAELDDAMLRAGERVDSLWTKETNETSGFYDLYDLIDWVNNVPDGTFYPELDSLFDRKQLARHIAVNTLITNSSTYYHNYFLVHDLRPGGKWRILPWDMDRSYRAYYSYSVPNYFICSHPMNSEVNELIRRCWRDDRMRNEIFTHVDGLIDSLMTYSYLDSLVSHLDTLLLAAVDEDTFKQYSIEDFHSNLDAIPTYVEGRNTYMRHSMENAPLPFTLLDASKEATGLRLRWESSRTADNGSVHYRVLLDTQYNLPNPEVIEAGSDTTFLIDSLGVGSWFWRVEAVNTGSESTQSIQFFKKFVLDTPLSTSQSLPDTVTANLTLTPDDGPLWLNKSVVVQQGVTLTFQAGLQVGISDTASLIVDGTFRAMGSIDHPVTFSSLQYDLPGGTIVRRGTESTLTIVHAEMKNLGGIISGVPNGQDAGEITLASSHLSGFRDITLRVESGHATVDDVQLHCNGENGILVRGGTLFINKSRLVDAGDEPVNTLVRCEGNPEQVEIHSSQLRTFHGRILLTTLNSTEMSLVNTEFRGGSSYIEGEFPLNIINSSWLECDTALSLGSTVSVNCYNSLFTMNGIALQQDSDGSEIPLVPYIRNTVFFENQKDVSPLLSNRWNVGFSYLNDADTLVWDRIHTGEPGVVDSWNGNWELLPGSQLIDAGWGTDAPERDVVNQQRVDVQGVPNTGQGDIDYVDIGLYEYPFGIVPFDPGSDSLAALFVYPNPTDGRVTISFLMESEGNAKLTIFNLLGQRVYQREMNGFASGRYWIQWEGMNDDNKPVASGLYIAQLQLQGSTRNARIILLR